MKYGPVLEDILLNKSRLIEESKRHNPIVKIEKLLETTNPPPEFKSIFYSDSVSLIAEIKRSSASAGKIFADLNLNEIVSTYVENGASAISILTEKTRFSGDISDLTEVSSITKLSNTPTLQKDFVIDEYQVVEGRANGASAILIIVSILSEQDFKKIIDKCKSVNITPLVEVFTEEELDLALSVDVEVIGINNRNLNNLETSLKVFENLGPKVPKEKFVIAESGLKKVQDVELMAECGADAVLIGESILKNSDMPSLINQLSSVKKCK